MATILKDAGLSEIIDGELERVAAGFEFTEGPLWLPDGALLFQDLKADRTHRLGPDGTCAVLREGTRAANGQTFGPDGRIVFCEQNGRRVSTMARDGSDVRPLVEEWSGGRLNSPNDVVCRSDGQVFFTDPPYGVEPAARALHFQGVYRIDPRKGAGSLALEADDFERPNGLAFDPSESLLYVCDTARYTVRAIPVDGAGRLLTSKGGLFARLEPGVPGGPDGIKVDREGRVYVAVALGVWVFEPGGRLMGILATPGRPSNLAFGGPDRKTLHITAVDAVHRVRLRVEGVAPPFLGPDRP